MITVPESLAATCRGKPERMAWLNGLPEAISALQRRWALSLGEPFTREVSCAWVAPVVREDGSPAVLKLGMPHMEAAHEIDGLRFWDGEPTVRLLDASLELNAMLLERCAPGTSLRDLPEAEQDLVVAGLLQRLWRVPTGAETFRPLSAMVARWVERVEAMLAARAASLDEGLVRAGLHAFQQLAVERSDEVLLATDLHAGNVLRAQREPWLVIDPKPFVGDRAFDASLHLLNCRARLAAAPVATIRRFADLIGLNHERLRMWMFARIAAEPRPLWTKDSLDLARALA
jgi:streptomycin 6-kinase